MTRRFEHPAYSKRKRAVDLLPGDVITIPWYVGPGLDPAENGLACGLYLGQGCSAPFHSAISKNTWFFLMRGTIIRQYHSHSMDAQYVVICDAETPP